MYSFLDKDNNGTVRVERNTYAQICDTVNPPGIESIGKSGELATLISGERSGTLSYVGVKRSGTPAEKITIFTDNSKILLNPNDILADSKKITIQSLEFTITLNENDGIEIKNNTYSMNLNNSGIELKDDSSSIKLGSSGIELVSTSAIKINGAVFTPDGDVFTSSPLSYSLREHIHPTQMGPTEPPNPPNPPPTS